MRVDEAYAELKVVQDFIPAGNSNRPGKKLAATSITIHNTDNEDPGANAAAHAKYQKGADARKRKVSWHFTVDDKSVYQSLPINEVGWHANKGNATSIGIEICMNAGLDAPAAYKRAALLTAVLAFQNKIKVPSQIRQHHDWSGKHCPRVLRDKPNGWKDFLEQIKQFRDKLTDVPAPAIAMSMEDDHHRSEAGATASARSAGKGRSRRPAKKRAAPRRRAKR
jgi:N-acetylmuramoyl-L-alanine amidase CwlA